MSVAGDIVTALLADVAAAISGVTTSTEAIAIEQASGFPFAMILQTDYDAEWIEWGQERRTWTISGTIVQEGGTREDMQTKLEDIQTQIVADPTLGGSVERAIFGGSIPQQHPDAKYIYGLFAVQAEKVV